MTHHLAEKDILQVESELDWLSRIIVFRLTKPEAKIDFQDIAHAPDLKEGTHYMAFVEKYEWGPSERLALALGIAAVYKPEVLLPFTEKFKDTALQYRFGGNVRERSISFTPTVRTIWFLLSGNDPVLIQHYRHVLHGKHRLFRDDILRFTGSTESMALPHREVEIDDRFLDYFIGEPYPRLDNETDFPATLSETPLSFEDVVLPDKVKAELEDLTKFIRNRHKLRALGDIRKRLKTSYVVIFSGEPGTGKTVTARTIGKKYGMPVYIVNLSRIVSKYIGETEKNLERVFDRFDGQDCILFFDEADALFGKRTEVKDSKDRYANQEVAFLLQKIEAFEGIVILATNVNDVQQSFDKAFQRRIRRQIKFEFPTEAERLLLWEKTLPAPFAYEESLAQKLARNYQLTGSNIHNITSDVIIEALDQDTKMVTFDMVEPYLKTEFQKRGMKYEVTTDDMVQKSPQKRLGNVYRRNF
ncbi:ATP-binding protein [Roseivirga sp. BDSF3-8]|uniref:ATP-binding protein n=1 Tax=Roseivirga sp. BDSF3-8 TaxID=3241598 RepID=UPI003532193D